MGKARRTQRPTPATRQRPATPDAPPPVRSDRERTEAALLARIRELRGEKLTERDRKDLNWLRERDALDIVNETLTALPKKLYVELSGRQHKVLDDAADRYDLPIRGATVDLFEAIRALHDRLVEFASRQSPALDGDLEELRLEELRQKITKLQRQSTMLEIDIDRRRDQLVERDVVRDRLAWLSGRLQSLGARLSRSCGPEGQKILNEFLDSLAVELDGGTLSL